MPAFTTPDMDLPNNYQTTYDIKTKIIVFYSLSTRPCHFFHIMVGMKAQTHSGDGFLYLDSDVYI